MSMLKAETIKKYSVEKAYRPVVVLAKNEESAKSFFYI